MKKSVEYEIKNGAVYSNERTREKVADLMFHYLPIEITDLPWSEMPDEIRAANKEIHDLDLTSYYMPDGRKITKPLKRIAQKFLGKDIVNEKWADIANEISKLYSPKFSCRAFWGNKKLLGSGTYEGQHTCFRNGGENETSRRFLEKYDRTQVLVLENMENDDDKARCIAYFAGGRNIYLTNFYFRMRFPQNALMFVEALRRLIGIDDVIFKDKASNPKLPIYMNGHCIHIHTKRSFYYSGTRKLPCPHCDDVVSEHDFFHERNGSTHYLGCSDDCGGHSGRTCDNCGGRLDEDDVYSTSDDNYCESCFDDSYFHCHDCGEATHNDNGCHAGNYSYCEYCFDKLFVTCDQCGDPVVKGEHYYSEYLNEDQCESCYQERHDTCEQCGESFHNDELTEYQNYHYCGGCLDKYFYRCTDCNEKVHEDDTILFGPIIYCEDCHDARFVECHECKEDIDRDNALEIASGHVCSECATEETGVTA
jgi:hypothetical protein